MPRPRSKNLALVEYPGLVARPLKGKTRYYLQTYTGKRVPLGDKLDFAIKRYKELLHVPITGTVTFAYAAEQYREKVLPRKTLKTQRGQNKELDNLKAAFPEALLDEIEPVHIALYRDRRSAKTAASREIALFSHLWNWSREQGYTGKANPVQGVRKNPERPRERYVTDAEYQAVLKHADPALQDAMELAYLTGQRPADVFAWRLSDIAEGYLHVRQRKTGKLLRIAITGQLANLIERIRRRPRKATGFYLVQTDTGQKLSYTMFRRRFDAAKQKAAAEGIATDWQFRDLRAKNASDSNSLVEAQERLGHESSSTTKKHYRRGEKVSPLK